MLMQMSYNYQDEILGNISGLCSSMVECLPDFIGQSCITDKDTLSIACCLNEHHICDKSKDIL